MAPPHIPRTPEKQKSNRHEADTVTKSRFYHAIDTRGSNTIKWACEKENIPFGTGKHWLVQRRRLGSDISHRRLGANRIGRPFKIFNQQLDDLVNPKKNKARFNCIEAQIQYLNLECHVRTAQRSLRLRKKNARLYSMAKTKWIPPNSRQARQAYGREHKGKTLADFWAYIGFTDEAHIDPSAMKVGYVLREEGTRYQPENVVALPPLEGAVFHIAACVS